MLAVGIPTASNTNTNNKHNGTGDLRAAIWAILALWRTRHAPERRLFSYCILCEVHPSTELINRVGWSQILSDPGGGRPGTTAPRPLGEIGCFWTTFLGFDPSKLGISPSTKNFPGTSGRSFQRACVSCTRPISVLHFFRDLYLGDLLSRYACWVQQQQASNK